ncbi:fimbria/pilus chaperone family protein [Acinetobacter courvalinii]|uniref:fimbria/pilus chaperone family protein n=1 Tax=Acinetobacter courvalinii TaxID=280147 RepID=UPI0021CED332|nr:fimbria/pilus chaperone family protein [Acinetobacter courvalinii]MCU4369584.1 fimbria/pilus periplasmic chaperone [Acinetobacter courvalinii]MCU4447789.1 fimbria/pilus periplasmic chaperone [Acinetobacter courvalinii]
MKSVSLFKASAIALLFVSEAALAAGMVPETSVVIVEQRDGEGSINVKNTDNSPLLLLTELEDIKEDKDQLLIVTPPTARVEAGKSQRVRFIMADKTPLKTERLKRVTFEGVPPQQKGKNVVRVNVRQNLPVLIRPAGLEADSAPWKRLIWKKVGDKLTVNNPSPYVVRMGQGVHTLADNNLWSLPNAYILPGESHTLTVSGKAKADAKIEKPKDGNLNVVRISPATTWGFTVNSYDAPLSQ